MRNLFRNLLVVLLAMAGLAHAQTATTQTTLASAITSTSATSLNIASATGFTAGTTGLYVDQELMAVTSVNGTIIGVRRGTNGITGTHASGARVYVGPWGNGPFIASEKSGTCTEANENYLPQINTTSGMVYDCENGKWIGTSVNNVENVMSGSGDTETLSDADCALGATLLFDRAAGIVYTLPKPTVGLTCLFRATTAVTSNAYKISTATQGTDFIVGGYVNVDTDTSNAVAVFACDGSSHDNLSMNGTTTGGLAGTWLRFTAISSTLWQAEGMVMGSGTVATSCATS